MAFVEGFPWNFSNCAFAPCAGFALPRRGFFHFNSTRREFFFAARLRGWPATPPLAIAADLAFFADGRRRRPPALAMRDRLPADLAMGPDARFEPPRLARAACFAARALRVGLTGPRAGFT